MMTYEEARNFIEQTTQRGSILGLDNMYTLMEALGNPQEELTIVHIAGTNGKGSVGAYLAAILKEAGLKVGRYCSPAVFDPLECWQYDGRNITKEEYAYTLSQVKDACDIVALQNVQPTVFEVETATAFVYFKQMKVDVLLLETGLGGETDATNVIEHPLVCVFTTISRDHMQFLGETLTEIATVKAGIMKPQASVISAVQKPEVRAVLDEAWKKKNSSVAADEIQTGEMAAPAGQKGLSLLKKGVWKEEEGIIYVDENSLNLISQKPGELCFCYKGKDYKTSLSGIYQMQNAALAIEAAEEIFSKMTRSVTMFGHSSYAMLKDAKQVEILQNGVANTFWPGRFEVLGQNPLFIVDGAHNEDAVKQLALTIENSFTNQPITFIIGILADKEHEKMLELMMPYAKRIYTVTPPNPRGLDGRALAEEVKTWHENVLFCETIEEAVQKAIVYGRENKSPVIAFGSLSYLGQLKEYYKQIRESRMRDV